MERDTSQRGTREGHSPIRYLSVTTEDGASFLLRVTSQTARAIRGVEVDRDGEEVTGKGFDVRERIVEIGAIKKSVEMRMNVKYGRIERAK
jgi:hypothetical protein